MQQPINTVTMMKDGPWRKGAEPEYWIMLEEGKWGDYTTAIARGRTRKEALEEAMNKMSEITKQVKELYEAEKT